MSQGKWRVAGPRGEGGLITNLNILHSRGGRRVERAWKAGEGRMKARSRGKRSGWSRDWIYCISEVVVGNRKVEHALLDSWKPKVFKDHYLSKKETLWACRQGSQSGSNLNNVNVMHSISEYILWATRVLRQPEIVPAKKRNWHSSFFFYFFFRHSKMFGNFFYKVCIISVKKLLKSL